MNGNFICIVDDEDIVLKSLEELLTSVGYQVFTFNNPLEFLCSDILHSTSCLISDIRMKYMTGLALQDALLERQIKIPLIFISGHADVEMAVKAIKKGAIDFFTKPININDFLEAVNRGCNYSNTIDQLEEQTSEFNKLESALTARERDVMAYMVKGDVTKVIAKNLNLSPNTVDLYRSRIMKKMKVNSLAQLVRLVMVNSLN